MSVALITGATAGLGAEFANQLAAQGHDLVLVARDVPRLEETKARLESRSGRAIELLPADLATPEGCDAVAARLAAEPAIDLLINNAGFGLYQAFGKASLEDEERMLDLNVRAVLRLSHAAVRAMRERGRGRILNVASVAAFVPRAQTTTYGAGKAWVVGFTEGLAQLLDGTGVSATVVCPGFVRTEFHERAAVDMGHIPSWLWLQADEVVRDALAATEKGTAVVIPNLKYKTAVALSRATPRAVTRRLARMAQR